MENFIKYGNIEIELPTETIGYFWIFQNLTDFFGVNYQSEAVSLLKRELKKYADLKPKPNIDYEADNAHIDSRNADTIFKVAEIINDLAVDKFKTHLSTTEKQEILRQLKAWKKPKPKKWTIGDIFSMKLKDDSFMFGQVIGTHLTKKSPTCAVFELRKTAEEASIEELKKSRLISVENTDNEYLSNGTFKILFNAELFVSMEQAKKGKSTGDGTLLSLCNVYYGLEPWNVLYKDTYYDDMLLRGIERPKTVLFLDREARNKYRLERFGINENNERVKQKRQLTYGLLPSGLKSVIELLPPALAFVSWDSEVVRKPARQQPQERWVQ